jgi:hypothetical protein
MTGLISGPVAGGEKHDTHKAFRYGARGTIDQRTAQLLGRCPDDLGSAFSIVVQTTIGPGCSDCTQVLSISLRDQL